MIHRQSLLQEQNDSGALYFLASEEARLLLPLGATVECTAAYIACQRVAWQTSASALGIIAVRTVMAQLPAVALRRIWHRKEDNQGVEGEYLHDTVHHSAGRVVMGWGVFHVASGLIHLLLIVAIIALILHFVRGTVRAV